MMQDLQTAKRQIMRRIYFIWLFRTVFSPRAVKLMALAVLLWQFLVRVSVEQVFANWTFNGSLESSYTFWQAALLNTELTTQILIMGIGLVALLLARDALKTNLFVRI